MATITLPFSRSHDIQCELDINNANWRVSKARVINNSTHGLEIIVRKSGAVIFTDIAPPGQTTEWSIPGMQLGWQEDYWNEVTQQYEPDGLEMYDYTVQTRGAPWP